LRTAEGDIELSPDGIPVVVVGTTIDFLNSIQELPLKRLDAVAR